MAGSNRGDAGLCPIGLRVIARLFGELVQLLHERGPRVDELAGSLRYLKSVAHNSAFSTTPLNAWVSV
ncbi:hypothetical protein AWC20_12265 [Mycobacterium parmense]|nr:hypothetical protein AWC20_12265 [Mycobacterium parmense]